ncbi:hypothetical protein EAH89_14245 [Roseomonas nepalensis]|uniref:Dienelactone hydrolase domain-containing protein n=1 Tax=Muricoccus nepalensis TaxID=1854500 RepID=A0A502G3B2_9PROT|nr:hypothetical protein EAH89_14245 [Roseomonas nepalensis]
MVAFLIALAIVGESATVAALSIDPLCGGSAAPQSVEGTEPRAELVRLPEPVGLARLVRPAVASLTPLVIVLPDALSEDARSEPYVESLLRRGFAALVLGMGEDLDSPTHAVEPAASSAALGVALAWATRNGFDLAATAALGFGLGGRSVLAGAAGRPAAALYPGCSGLKPPAAEPALILQGAAAAQDCVAMPTSTGLTPRLLPGAGHAWDAPGAVWPNSGPVLPNPAGGGRLRARADLVVTVEAAEVVADWLAAALAPRVRSAPQ